MLTNKGESDHLNVKKYIISSCSKHVNVGGRGQKSSKSSQRSLWIPPNGREANDDAVIHYEGSSINQVVRF